MANPKGYLYTPEEIEMGALSSAPASSGETIQSPNKDTAITMADEQMQREDTSQRSGFIDNMNASVDSMISSVGDFFSNPMSMFEEDQAVVNTPLNMATLDGGMTPMSSPADMSQPAPEEAGFFDWFGKTNESTGVNNMATMLMGVGDLLAGTAAGYQGRSYNAVLPQYMKLQQQKIKNAAEQKADKETADREFGLKERELAIKEGKSNTPSSVQEFEYFQSLTPEQQQQWLSMEGKTAPKRQIIKGADGRNYYADTQEPVLPNVQGKVPKEKMVTVAGLNLIEKSDGEGGTTLTNIDNSPLTPDQQDRVKLGKDAYDRKYSSTSAYASAAKTADMIDNITEADIGNFGGLTSIGGAWTAESKASVGKANQLLSHLFTQNIEVMKGMGSLSNAEGSKITAAATALVDPKTNEIKEGISEKEIKKQLAVIKKAAMRQQLIAQFVQDNDGKEPTISQLNEMEKQLDQDQEAKTGAGSQISIPNLKSGETTSIFGVEVRKE